MCGNYWFFWLSDCTYFLPESPYSEENKWASATDLCVIFFTTCVSRTPLRLLARHCPLTVFEFFDSPTVHHTLAARSPYDVRTAQHFCLRTTYGPPKNFRRRTTHEPPRIFADVRRTDRPAGIFDLFQDYFKQPYKVGTRK